jgi:hypothetical protein
MSFHQKQFVFKDVSNESDRRAILKEKHTDHVNIEMGYMRADNKAPEIKPKNTRDYLAESIRCAISPEKRLHCNLYFEYS